MMEREHQEVGDALRLIRELTRGYAAPDDGCTTYAITMAELLQFERDLHRHVHLENNVLFPAAMQIEGRLCGSCRDRTRDAHRRSRSVRFTSESDVRRDRA